MKKLTIEIPDALSRKLARAAKQRRVPPVAIVREALAEKVARKASPLPPVPGSMWERIKDLCGSVDSGRGDLSTNKEYLKRMGREKSPVLKRKRTAGVPFVSAYDLMKDLCGTFDSGLGDLSTNKKYLANLGREKYRA